MVSRIAAGGALLALFAGWSAAADSPSLIQAIRANDVRGLKQAINQGVSVNAGTDRGTTPLMYAAAFGSLEAMKVLLGAGAAVNQKNAFDSTALMWAVADPVKVKFLLDQGADVNVKSKPGRTALMLAAMQNGSEETVRMLLAKGADLHAKDGMGLTMLQAAALGDNLPVMRLAVEDGVPVNAVDTMSGWSALTMVASNGNVKAARFLLDKGASVNQVSKEPGAKVKNGLIALGNFTPLMMAAATGPAELVRMLLDAGADVNAKDSRGMTPLHLSMTSETQDPAIVKMLLAAGASPSAKTTAGETATDWALKFGNPAVVGQFQPVRAIQATTVSAGAAAAKPAEIRAAAEKGLSLLQKTTSTFFKEGGCASCHAQNVTTMAAGLARQRGLAVDEAAAAGHLATIKAEWSMQGESLMLRLDPPGGYDMIGSALLALAGAGYKPDFMTDAMTHNIAVQQTVSGRWHAGGIARPPMNDSDIAGTAISLRLLQLYGIEGNRAAYSRQIAKARDWLLTATPTWTQDRAMLVLGLKWAGADASAVRKGVDELIATQRVDGGWCQNPNLPSDAFATGEVLYTLAEAGLASADPVYRRGVAWLLRTQAKDGSWHVKSRSAKFQPYFQSGFPYDHDQWISQTATAWATMALALAVEPDNRKTVASVP